MKSLWSLAALISISFCAFLACVTKQLPQPDIKELAVEDSFGVVMIKPDEPIHIACWMVVLGDDARLGIDTKRGVMIAVDDKGGRVLGHRIKITVYDSGCNADGGRKAATKIASDPTVIAAIGPNCSSEARAGAPILWKNGIPTVSPSNTSPYMTDSKRESDFNGYLRTSFNDKVQGVVAANFVYKQLKLKKVATIHDGTFYATTLQSFFVETFKGLGGTIIAQEKVIADETNIQLVLTKIAAGNPDAIYFPIFIAAGSHITRKSREIPSLEKVALISADATFDKEFYKAAGETAIGIYHTSPGFSDFGIDYYRFIDKYYQKYKEVPIAPFHAHAYDAAMMILAAIEKVAKKAPDGSLYIGRQALRDVLYATQNFKGLTGNLTCSPFGDCCAEPRIAVYKTTEANVRNLVLPNKPYWKPY